ncbi:Fic family protein [Syntrophus gentianae]|uniref:Fic family protein n=1 Tax=Syntrophus gentianae TaxID=43775 RepID=A0A1H7UNM4_9BACT|nr:Fic family protein [Syntrophus gentianae]SEL98652.1 Fic family protein [Syntrophus gentianae]
MKTLQRFSGSFEAIPSATSWHIADLAEACGRQASYKRQSSARLLTLQKHALVESAVSSNRIDGVKSEPKRAGGILSERQMLRRSDEAVLRYRKAMALISENEAELPLSRDTLLQLHLLICGETSDDSIPAGMEGLIALWSHSLAERWVHPLLLLTAFNLDFLCLRPFSDGNGRMSRLLLLLQSFHLGYDVGRYISLDRLIEENRNQYHEALEESSQGWQDGNHNPWPYIDYLLFIFKTAYGELESRLNVARCVRGAKTGQIKTAIQGFAGPFSLAELEKSCPGTSHDMVRKVLRDLRDAGSVECLGRGPGAQWQRKDNILSPRIDTDVLKKENLHERRSG